MQRKDDAMEKKVLKKEKQKISKREQVKEKVTFKLYQYTSASLCSLKLLLIFHCRFLLFPSFNCVISSWFPEGSVGKCKRPPDKKKKLPQGES